MCSPFLYSVLRYTMYTDKTMDWLMSLSLAQLEVVERVLQEKVAEKAEKEKQKRKQLASPPRSDRDVQAIAEMQGLDISGLMREINRR